VNSTLCIIGVKIALDVSFFPFSFLYPLFLWGGSRQNRRQKVMNKGLYACAGGGLYVCAGGNDIQT